MKLTTKQNLFGKELFFPVSSLLFASVACCALLALRILISGHWRQLYLVWNLFLAWLPLLFALMMIFFGLE